MKIDSFPFTTDLADGCYYMTVYQFVTEHIQTAIFNAADETTTYVELESKEEAEKLLDELDDADGTLCHASDSVCNKYPALEVFKP